jgi:hypothetical protein
MTCGSRKGRWWQRDDFGWGLVLLGLGTWFLLITNGVLSERAWQTWWPFAVVAMGVVSVIGARDAKGLGSAVTTLGIGLWLSAAVHHWYGLTWKNSWPLALVAAGLGSITEWAASLVTARKAPVPGEGGDHVG